MSPASRLSILLGAMSADLMRVTAQATIVVLVGVAVGVHFETGVPGALVLIALSGLFGLSYSGLGFAMALKTGNAQSTQTVQFLFLPLLFLSTLFAPREALSGWLATAARFNPLTYLLEGMRSLSMTGWDPGALAGAIAAVAALGTVSIGLALLAFRGRVR